MFIAQINVHLESPPKDALETLLPAALGIVGVFIGAWLTNVGQKRRDQASAAREIRSLALTAVAAIMANLGSVSTLVTFATADETPGRSEKLGEAQNSATATSATAQNAVAVLAGVADSEVAKHGALLHSQLTKMSDELMKLFREGKFDKAKDQLEAHRTEIQRGYNILIFMVQSRDQLLSGGNWWGVPFFRTRKQASLYHDHLAK